jgi:hypothetical protein
MMQVIHHIFPLLAADAAADVLCLAGKGIDLTTTDM